MKKPKKHMPNKKPTKPKQVKPLNSGKRISLLRLVNFVIVFSLVGVWFMYFTQAATTAGFYGSIEKDQVTRINNRRASVGRSGLSHIDCLNNMAEAWTKNMASKGSISHNPNLGAQVDSYCGGYWTIIGENVGVGYDSTGLFNAFVASPGHLANIENAKYTRIGVGAYKTTDGKLWVTHVFANCSTCTTAWNTAAKLPADPVAVSITWPSHYVRNSNSGGAVDASYKYGTTGDIPFHCDWNGDKKDTAGVFRKGAFYLTDDNRNTKYSFSFGTTGDIPICGDWDGNGKDSIGIYRPSTATFHIRNSNSAGTASSSIRYGGSGDKPLVGDWDGNGTDTLGVWRAGSFYLRNSWSGGNPDIQFVYGSGTDTPLVGDWNADGKDTPGIWRSGSFYLRNTNSGGSGEINFSYGTNTDKPEVGDWDGNGTSTIGIVR